MVFKIINKRKGRVSGKFASKAAALLLSLFVINACSPNNSDSCIEADDWGDSINKTIMVKAKDQFTNSGIYLGQGSKLEIKISGMVDLCPTQISMGGTGQTRMITPAKSGWQDSGVTLDANDQSFKINVSTISDSKYISIDNVEQRNGKGLYAYILPGIDKDDTPAQVNAAIAAAGINSDMWFGTNKRLNSNGNCVGGGSCNFFEVYNNGVGEYSGKVPVSGRLLFRYARSPDMQGISNVGDGAARYSPWRGKYKWGDYCEGCTQKRIWSDCAQYAIPCAIIGAYGLCLVACGSIKNGICRGDGTYELPTSDPAYYASRCQEFEHSDLGITPLTGGYWGRDGLDHWVDENFSRTGNVDVYNDGGGYIMNVSNGCQGTLGRYLQMNIPTSIAYEEVDHTPPCPDGYSERLPQKCISDVDGSKLKKVIPKIAHQECGEGSWCDLNSSGISANGNSISVPATFAPPAGRPGYYSSLAPYNGDLWFEIVDSRTESNDAHPDGGYYEDNLGSYKVSITTESVKPVTQALNVIIKPIKKIIYGYCNLPPSNTMSADQIADLTEEQCTGGAAAKKAVAECLATMKETKMSAEDCNANNAWKIGITQFMYNKLVNSPLIVDTIRSALVLLVVVYGMLFMMGMIQSPVPHVIGRIVRVGIVIQLISPYSWDFFNRYLFTFFIDGLNQLISIVTSDFMGVASVKAADGSTIASTISNPFMFADKTLGLFLSHQTWGKIFGLLFSSPIGFIYIILIIVGMVYFVKALLKAAIMYVLSMLVIALLLILAPIFIAFLLFDFTRAYFKKWIDTLVNYLFQPVLVFAALAIFNMFVYSALYSVLHYRVCWQNILFLPNTSIPIFTFLMPDAGYTSYGTVLSNSSASGVPIGFFVLLIFIIVANIMWKMIDFMSELVAHIAVAEKSASIATAVTKLADKAGGMSFAAFTGGISKLGKAISDPKAAMKGGAAAMNPKAMAARAALSVANSAKNTAKGALGMKTDDKKK